MLTYLRWIRQRLPPAADPCHEASSIDLEVQGKITAEWREQGVSIPGTFTSIRRCSPGRSWMDAVEWAVESSECVVDGSRNSHPGNKT